MKWRAQFCSKSNPNQPVSQQCVLAFQKDFFTGQQICDRLEKSSQDYEDKIVSNQKII